MIEPPTEEEMNMAITGNFGRLMTVVSFELGKLCLYQSLTLADESRQEFQAAC